MSAKISLMTLAGRRFALPAEVTLHIMKTPTVFRLPVIPGDFGGVFWYQGELAPLFRLDRFFVPEKNDFPRDLCYTVVCATEFGPIGLPADRVVKIVDSASGRFEDHPQQSDAVFCRKDFVYEALPYPLLEIDRLLAERYQSYDSIPMRDEKEA